jgi:hypothetical protein
VQVGDKSKLTAKDQYEFDLTKENSWRAVQGKNINENLKNLNWHDQHVKTNLDSKITPLT